MTREDGAFYGGLGFIVLAGVMLRFVEHSTHPRATTASGLVIAAFGLAISMAAHRRGGGA